MHTSNYLQEICTDVKKLLYTPQARHKSSVSLVHNYSTYTVHMHNWWILQLLNWLILYCTYLQNKQMHVW